jgi:hypothetical protein
MARRVLVVGLPLPNIESDALDDAGLARTLFDRVPPTCLRRGDDLSPLRRERAAT